MNLMHALLAALLLLVSPMAGAQQGQTEGINDSYKAPGLEVEEWIARFESQGREAFDLRHEIVGAIGLEPGQIVADVGAGTGLFVPLLAEAVGDKGQVYAIDIAPAFIEHIAAKSRASGLRQVKTVLSTERSIEMPANSLDVIFTSDAYHHFVHYEDMLASMRRALKPGGQLIVVDFDIEAKDIPRQMIGHVGRTKEEFARQIQDAGFRFAEDLTLDAMKTSFMYRFVNPGPGKAQFLNSPAMAKLGLPFSEAVRAGDLLILSGQIGNAEGSTDLVPGGIAAESRQALQNIRSVLERNGSSLAEVVKCTVFLADIAEWGEFNKVYREFFEAPFPARSALGANGLAMNARVELECIAYAPQHS